MRRSIVFLLCLVYVAVSFAQEKMYIHKSDHVAMGVLISEVDSVYFSNDGSIGNFKIGENLAQYWLCFIDSISFGENSGTIVVNYNGTWASVINPLAFEGVSVEVNGADVTVTSRTEIQDINYQLSGTTADGMFKIYSEKRFNLLLNGVNITNANGPAINIQANKKAAVTLVDGTVNTLADGGTYADLVSGINGQEDQDAAFFSEGKLVFSGNGSLTITGSGTEKHALCSDGIIEINGGTIIVTSAPKDGIHAKDGIIITGGTVNVTATGDAIDGDEGYLLISGGLITTGNAAANADGITCDSILNISGGTIQMTVSGNQSKGIRSAQNMTLSGGDITINTSGAAVLEVSGSGYDPVYCTGIKCSSAITISGANITITSTGAGGKGISSDTDIIVTAGNVKITTSGNGTTYTNSSATKDSYHASCITADGNISIPGGSVTASSSGSGGKGITCDGNLTIGDAVNSTVLNITTTGTKITISSSTTGPGGFSTGNYDEAKAIKSDGAITISNGIT
ncbi:MAG TPA: carbohydrate-binding domain-containing protein, partial [Bacteroidales bacterium]|nr:carbohydrate-binding domain-containing protein [Bacteroidales bacterium]